MREGLFSALLASEGSLSGCRFLDLYAGSGAVGIEAWSRGAEHVLAVEHDQRAVRVIKSNADTVGAEGAVVVRLCAVDRLASTGPAGGPYDVVFADPPYDHADEHLGGVLTALHAGGWVRHDALVVVERSSRGAGFGWPPWVEPEKSRIYGEGTLWYGRVRPVPAPAAATVDPLETAQPAPDPREG